MTSYTTNDDRAKLDRKAAQARQWRARKRERKEAHRVLDSMKVLALENSIKRAPRSGKDKAGRQLKLRGNVASMIRQLIFWEGKGEAEGSWIWKTAEEWFDEAGMTYRMLRLARDVAKAEGLLEYEERGPVGESRVYYRLDMTAVLRVVAESELDVAREWLEKHPRSKKRPEFLAEKRRWESVLEDLRAWGVADSLEPPEDDQETGNLQPELRRDTVSTPAKAIGKGNPRASEEESVPDLTTPLTSCKGSPDNLSDHQCITPSGFRYTSDPPGGAIASPVVDAPAAKDSVALTSSTEGKDQDGDREQSYGEEVGASAAPKRKRYRLPVRQTMRLVQLIEGINDDGNELHRLARLHVEGEADGEGPITTVERVAEKAREMLAPDLPAEDVFDAVEGLLENMRRGD